MKNWLKGLTLTQQLLLIIFSVVIGFSVCEVNMYTDTLNVFVQQQMYQNLMQIQPAIENAYLNNDSAMYQQYIQKSVQTMTYMYTKDGLVALSENAEQEYTELQEILNVMDRSEDQLLITYKAHKVIHYGVVSFLSKDTALVTILSPVYVANFKAAVLDNILNYNVLIVIILFFFLMLWVSSIIHPLNKINDYIQKIKNGEEVQLKIQRKDEIGQVAESLVAMSKELSEQNRVKEEMIQNISHDLKTPIATIKSYGESIKDGIYPYDSLEKSVDVIIENADRLEKKVVSLLVLNKMGYLSDTVEEGNHLDMVQVIEKAILSLKVIRPELKMTTDLEYEFFHGEEEPWRIVVENILDNAIRYAKSEIIIELRKDSLAIYNDGPQMSPERLAKMFKPYEKGTDGKFGLGMSIVHRVCVTYGYKVMADNTDNGVVFRITKNK